MAWQSPVVAFDPNHAPIETASGTFLPGPTMERPLCDVKRKSSTGKRSATRTAQGAAARGGCSTRTQSGKKTNGQEGG